MKGKDSVYGVDFAGGQIQEYQFKKDVDVDEIRRYFKKEGVKDVSLYSFKDMKNVIALRSLKDSFNELSNKFTHYDTKFTTCEEWQYKIFENDF